MLMADLNVLYNILYMLMADFNALCMVTSHTLHVNRTDLNVLYIVTLHTLHVNERAHFTC
jgi:hypothetical protein